MQSWTTRNSIHTYVGVCVVSLFFNRIYLYDLHLDKFDLPAVLQAMASPEDKAYDIMRELDVGYVLVIFGGLTGYSSDGAYSYFVLFVYVYALSLSFYVLSSARLLNFVTI